LNLRFLETFIWVARLRSFSLAAEKVHATQAGVSARIAALERELGVRLFQREVRDVRLTTEGLAALERAEVIVRQVSELKAQISDPATLRGSIHIGVIDTISFTWLPELLDQAQRRFPMVSFAMRSDTSSNLGHALLAGEVELALLMGPLQERGVSTLDLCTYGCRWVASPRLGLHDRDLSLQDLTAYRILSFPDDSSLHASMLHLAREQANSPARFFTSNSLATIIRLTVDGLGVAALPEATVEAHLASGELRALAVTPAFPPLTVHAAWMDDPGNPLPGVVAVAAQKAAAEFCAMRPAHVARI
jgi:DNA-binding transcriptional LysR family regulator